MVLQKIVWHLPRPSSRYKGSYPLHFEKKFKKLINCDNYLHAFSGSSKTGLRIDLKFENKPDVVCDVHYLPFKDNCFPAVLADPPYSNQLAKDLYNTPKLKPMTYTKEFVRVTKPGGKICIYHWFPFPRLEGTKYSMILLIITRIWQYVRVCTIFEKLMPTSTL